MLSEIDPGAQRRPGPPLTCATGADVLADQRQGASRHERRSPPRPASDVLVRYVNPGLENVTMTMLGAARSASRHRRLCVQLTRSSSSPRRWPPAQTVDALVRVPASAAVGARFPVYNRQLHLTNGSLADPEYYAPDGGGGMLTFIEVQ